MAEVEEVPINERHVRHLPGDRVRVEIGFFRHEMNLKEVFAAFEHEESHEPFEVTLRGHPEEWNLHQGMKFSRVILSTIVLAIPCRKILMPAVGGVETFGARRIAFDSSTEETWRNWHFLVREEPAAPPSSSRVGKCQDKLEELGRSQHSVRWDLR